MNRNCGRFVVRNVTGVDASDSVALTRRLRDNVPALGDANR